MKATNYLIKLIITVLLSAVVFLTGCNYTSKDAKLHKGRIDFLSDVHKKDINSYKKPVIEDEVELFERKVSATFFNEPLKTVLPTLVSEIEYQEGVDYNQLVSLESTGQPIYKVLHKILKPIGLSYIRTTGGILVIKQKRVTFRAFNQPLDIVLNAMLGDISYLIRDGAELSLKETVSVEFEDLPIELAIDRVLSQLNLSWRKEADSYVIFRDKEATFTVNFPLIEQSFNVNSSRNISNNNENQDDEETDGDQGISTTSSNVSSSGANASVKNLVSTIEKFLTDTGRVIIHRELGMIWVKDRSDVVDRIDGFIAQVNMSLSRSVSINGVITEVDLYENNKAGIDWNTVATTLISAGATIANTGLTAGGATGSNFTLGWKNSAGTKSYNTYINALKTFGDVKVVSRPSLRVANNAIGSLVVGKNTSYVAEVVATASSSSPTTYASKLKSLETGLNFYVLPHIISNTEAVLYISPELTSLKEMRRIGSSTTAVTGDAQGEAAATIAPSIEAPTITMRQTQTVVPIRNGESIVIGGLMAETTKKINGVTPLLGSIPLLGRLFQTEDTVDGVSEFSLMVQVSW